MSGARGKGAERRVAEAFEGVRAPEGLKARTLARVEEARRAEKDEGPSTAASPGQIVLLAPRRERRRRALRLAAAACLVLTLLGMGGVSVALTPTAYVDIDVNPSIELGVNRFDGVVSATALNDDGERVLSEANVLWRSYGDAVEAIGEELEEAGYLTGDSVVSVTVSCDDEGQYAAISSASHECLADSADEVRCAHASEEERHAAHDAGMGVGKWRVWRELVDSGTDLSAEDAAGMTMRELRDLCEGHGIGGAADPAAGAGATDAAGGAEGERATARGHHDRGPRRQE